MPVELGPAFGEAALVLRFDLDATARARIAVLVGLAFLLIVTSALGLFDTADTQTVEPTVPGKVTAILEDRIESSPRGDVRTIRIEVEVDGQRHVTEEQRAVQDVGGLKDIRPGDRVLLATTPGEDGPVYYIADRVRAFPLWALTMTFVVLVLVIAGAAGAWSLVGMAVSLVVIIKLIIPAILSGTDPVLVSLVGSFLILGATLVLSHGFERRTVIVLGGIGLSLALAALIATVSIDVLHLTGVADDEALTFQIQSGGSISAEGLLLAGIIIGALGVLDDVAVAQTSSVFELHDVDPSLTPRELYRRGMNVGRDHIASTINTLLLAYAGASLPLLLILSAQSDTIGNLLNREFMATEIVRTVVGSIGIIAAVPITTALAAYFAHTTTKEASS